MTSNHVGANLLVADLCDALSNTYTRNVQNEPLRNGPVSRYRGNVE